MTLGESVGRFCVRKTLRFEMKPLGKTAEYIQALVDDNEERAAGLNAVKDIITAQHQTLVKRVFKTLPDPLPQDVRSIAAAFMADPEYRILADRNAYNVLNLVTERCQYHRWAIPKAVKDIHGWSSLYVKWHWHCQSLRSLTGSKSLPVQWAGKAKSEIERVCEFLKPCKKRKPTRNYWFDHSPFRMMFDNHTAGISWLKEDFAVSRNFLMMDGDRILVGVVPRSSQLNPYRMPPPIPTEQCYLLYEETAGETPRFRAIPRALVDAPAHRGSIYLFELTGRCLRGRTNLNAMYLRSLLTEGNFSEDIFHLDKSCEFHLRKGVDISREDRPAHFRQRFTESKFFITLHITCNAHLVSTGKRPDAFRNASKYIKDHPYAKFVKVIPAQGGYSIVNHGVFGETETHYPIFISTTAAKNGLLASQLAKRVIADDVLVLFDKRIPEPLKKHILDKFAYIVIKGRDAFAAGGVMRGYQLVDRLFVGALPPTPAEQEAIKLAAEQERIRAKEEKEKAKKERHAALVQAQREEAVARLRAAGKPQTCDPIDFTKPPFTDGKYKFVFTYKTADGYPHDGECMADFRNQVYEKLKALSAVPGNVRCYDQEFLDHYRNLPGRDIGKTLYRYRYRTAENANAEGTCRGDNVDEVHFKLHELGIRPFFVEPLSDDCAVAVESAAQPSDGAAVRPLEKFRFIYKSADGKRHRSEIEAYTKDDAYDRLRRIKIRPIYVLAEGEEEPRPKTLRYNDQKGSGTTDEPPIAAQPPPEPPTAAPQPAKVQPPEPTAPSAPAPAVAASAQSLGIGDRLKRLNALKEQGLLTDVEYAEQRAKIISEL